MSQQLDINLDINKPEKIEILTTNSTIHFTEELLKNEFENEDITNLHSNNCVINGISILSKQALNFRLLFWKNNTFNNSNINNNSYIGNIELDLTSNPTINFDSFYRLNVEDAKLTYIDLDNLNTLHISLLNLSNETKKAGIDGEVKLDIKLSPRL